MTIYTIGHSTRTIKEFVDLLNLSGVTQLIDIRTIPKSRHNPQYTSENLEKSLDAQGIRYFYLKELGGLRPKVNNTENYGWRNVSFRNYADYMQSEEFRDGMDSLVQRAKQATTAIMCAEAVPWRCHRSLVGDALLVRHVHVADIISKTNIKEHALTSFAVVKDHKITYPPEKT